MADQEGAQEADESLELAVFEWFKLRVPAIIILALFGDAARSKRKLRVLSESATQKAVLGESLTEDEQLVHDLDMARASKEHMRLLKTGARAAEVIAKEPKLLPGHVDGRPTPEPQAPSEGWSDRYRDGAKLGAEPDVREMWARILASEVTRPGSFSFKTLSVLKDVDPESAQAFVRLLTFCFVDIAHIPGAVPTWGEFREAYDAAALPYGTFQRFEELGLLNFSGRSSLAELTPPMVLGCGRYGFMIPKRTRQVSVHTLTRAGSELACVTDFKRSKSGLLAQGHWLASRHEDLHLAVYLTAQDYEARPWSPEHFAFDDASGAVSHIRA